MQFVVGMHRKRSCVFESHFHWTVLSILNYKDKTSCSLNKKGTMRDNELSGNFIGIQSVSFSTMQNTFNFRL